MPQSSQGLQLQAAAELERRRRARPIPTAAEFGRTLGFEPDPWQERFLSSRAPRILLNCSRQSGKSTTTGLLALHQAVFYPGSLVLLVSRSERQAGELFRKTRDFMRQMASPPVLIEDNKLSIEMASGSRIVSLPSSEETIRSFSSVALILEDEASRVPDALYRSIRPMLAVSHGRLVLMTTPFGKRGHFFEEWSSTRGWERYEVPATECPRITAEFLAEEREALGEWWFAQEYLCQFGENVDGMFTHDQIMDAHSDDVQPLFDGATTATSDGVIPLFGGG